MIPPLRKQKLDGTPYERPQEIERIIKDVTALSRSKLADRCAITDRSDPAYVPSECIMHLVRASRNDNSQAGFERIYPTFMALVIRALPRSESADGQLVSATQSEINDKVLHRLEALLSADRNEYSDKLDYFEIRFDGGLASLRRENPALQDLLKLLGERYPLGPVAP